MVLLVVRVLTLLAQGIREFTQLLPAVPRYGTIDFHPSALLEYVLLRPLSMLAVMALSPVFTVPFVF